MSSLRRGQGWLREGLATGQDRSVLGCRALGWWLNCPGQGSISRQTLDQCTQVTRSVSYAERRADLTRLAARRATLHLSGEEIRRGIHV
ncbi:MAG: hypothetical protein AAGJ28_13700 [Pseudomonadota bacterium]